MSDWNYMILQFCCDFLPLIFKPPLFSTGRNTPDLGDINRNWLSNSGSSVTGIISSPTVMTPEVEDEAVEDAWLLPVLPVLLAWLFNEVVKSIAMALLLLWLLLLWLNLTSLTVGEATGIGWGCWCWLLLADLNEVLRLSPLDLTWACLGSS